MTPYWNDLILPYKKYIVKLLRTQLLFYHKQRHADRKSTFFAHIHDDAIKWKRFPRNWPLVRRIHRWSVNSPHKGQWRGALMLSLICARIKGWVNNRKAGDLRRDRAHYDVIVMINVRFSYYYVSNTKAPLILQYVMYGTAVDVTNKRRYLILSDSPPELDKSIIILLMNMNTFFRISILSSNLCLIRYIGFQTNILKNAS